MTTTNRVRTPQKPPAKSAGAEPSTDAEQRSSSPAQATEEPAAEDVSSQSLSFLESLYEDYLSNPASVSPEWRSYFQHLVNGAELDAEAGHALTTRSVFRAPRGGNGLASPAQLDAAIMQERVDQLIRNYRVRGHFAAKIDPLGQSRPALPELEPEYYGFAASDLDRQVSTINASGPDLRTLREVIEWLRTTYCRSIGVQFMHIDDVHVREWLQQRMEGTENRLNLTRDEQIRILTRLSDAVVFEEFIAKKFLGAKSFSLEGAESLIPLLDLAIEKAGEDGVQEIVLGMAHRGRLNVLANIMGKSPRAIFREFADLDPQLHFGRGDVKYHLGYSNDWTTATGRKIHLSLCFNPSHLEFVNPVAMGRMRAKQDRFGDTERRRGMALLIHGDAAFAGEGIVQESLNLSELDATTTGGTIHVVVNNQIGFTTGPNQGRSTEYATDVAKMLQAPIFHVNGEDPEAVAQVVRLAMDFRTEFHRDVFIDMYCFRLRGHNETDEPSFTQPLMYKAIAAHESVRVSYMKHLHKLNEITSEEADRIVEQRRQQLELELTESRSENFVHRWDMLGGIWKGYKGGNISNAEPVETGLPVPELSDLLERLTVLPEGFQPHPKVEALLKQRAEMARGQRPLDWSAGEALALASLAVEGYRVRLHGQDVERGTFSHRHSMLHDVTNGATYMPLKHLDPQQAPVEIYNSALSEAGVLGFEYGYSLDWPDGLIAWEAQFGDFVNAAQVIIDQFIVSAEDKWSRLSGLVMLLPHGFEGAGPEHSSARLERFLTLAAEDNIQIVYPTTPAQYFHLLRRQVLCRWRKPLVVMTPKSLLRHRVAVSSLEDCSRGSFRRVLLDEGERSPQDVKQILLCSGKVYYDLIEQREALKRPDVAILRLEELYPLPEKELREALAPYADDTPVTWVQEEPENMGAWRYLRVQFCGTLLERFPFRGVYRAASASPATGSKKSHDLEQQQLLAEAFAAS